MIGKHLSENLLHIRKNKSLELDDLAAILKIKKEKLAAFEEGGQLPTITELDKIARFFGVETADLFLPVPISAPVKTKTSITGAQKSAALPRDYAVKDKGFNLPLAIVSLCLAALMLIFFALPVFEAEISLWQNYVTSYQYSGYKMIFDISSAPAILLFVSLIIITIWDFIAITIHLLGRNSGNAYKKISLVVSKVLFIVGACLTIIVYILCFNIGKNVLTAEGFCIYLKYGHWLILSLVVSLATVKIVMACLMKKIKTKGKNYERQFKHKFN